MNELSPSKEILAAVDHYLLIEMLEVNESMLRCYSTEHCGPLFAQSVAPHRERVLKNIVNLKNSIADLYRRPFTPEQRKKFNQALIPFRT